MTNGQRGGQPGNNNAAKSKDWANAIRWVVENYENEGLKLTKGQALRAIAQRCLEDALAGDKDARAEIGNRLDGKAAQSLTVAGDPENPLTVQTIALKAVDAS